MTVGWAADCAKFFSRSRSLNCRDGVSWRLYCSDRSLGHGSHLPVRCDRLPVINAEGIREILLLAVEQVAIVKEVLAAERTLMQ